MDQSRSGQRNLHHNNNNIIYAAIAIGTIALLGVIAMFVIYFFFGSKTQGPQGPQGIQGNPGPPGTCPDCGSGGGGGGGGGTGTVKNVVRYTINNLGTIPVEPSQVRYTYTYGNQDIISGTSEFKVITDALTSASTVNNAIQYTGKGGWYLINTSSSFYLKSGIVQNNAVTLSYNYNDEEAMTVTNAYYTTTYNGSYLLKLSTNDLISLAFDIQFQQYITVTNNNKMLYNDPQQNYIMFQQL